MVLHIWWSMKGSPSIAGTVKKLIHSFIECRVLEKRKQAEQGELERIEEKAQEGNTLADKKANEIKENEKIQKDNQHINNSSDEASNKESIEIENMKEHGVGKVNETREKQYNKKESHPENAEKDESTKIENAGKEELTNAEKVEITEEDNTMRKRTRRKKKRNKSENKVSIKETKCDIQIGGKHDDGKKKEGKQRNIENLTKERGTSQSRRRSNSGDKS